jgi:ATP-binding cassette, subfamily B, bacterial
MPELKLKRFREVLRKPFRSHAAGFVLAGGASIGFAATELMAPWPVKLLLDHVLLSRPWPSALAWLPGWMGGADATVLLLAALVLGLAVLRGAFSYSRVFITSRIGYQMVHELRSTLFAHLQRLSLSFHQRARTGELLNKVTSDTNVLKDALSGSLLELAGQLLMLAGMCVVLVMVNGQLASIASVSVPLLALVMFTIYRRGKTAARRQRENEGLVAARIGEMLHLTTVVRAFAREHDEQTRFTEESARTFEASVQSARTEAASSRVVELFSAAGVSVALLLGGQMAIRREISPGELVLFLTYLTNMYKPLRHLAKLTGQLAKARASAERIEQILRLEPDPSYQPGLPAPDFRGEIEFRSVRFEYEPGALVLRDLSFTIRAGERVALVGASGAGKSTVASLLLRMQAPQSGTILVDGRPVTEFDGASFRRRFGVVLQDSLLLGATIADNIAYGAPQASALDIQQAARAAAAHTFIAEQPDGYNTVVGERGSTLSGGQRQRICLARALLTNPSILILDEPTSAVDAESGAVIHRAISRMERTTIVIAHDFHDMRAFDRILVLDNGVIVESGSHDELVQAQGLYQALHAAQEATV